MESQSKSLVIAYEYFKEEYEIFKVPEAKLSELLSAKRCFIKDSTIGKTTEVRAATLHTQNCTFDLIKLDSSNLLLLTNKKDNYGIFKQDHHIIEAEMSKASKNQVWELLKSKGIYYDDNSDFAGLKANRVKNEGITFEELLLKCQTSEVELRKTLDDLNAFELNNKLFVFDPADRIYRAKALVLELHKAKIDWNNIDCATIKKSAGKLPDSAFSALLNSLFDFHEGAYSLHREKAKILCAMLLFNEKQNYLLKEFVLALSKIMRTLLPFETTEASEESWISNNLFPGYAQADLRFLHKIAVITFDKKDPVIDHVDYLALSENAKKRFSQLGSIKKEWTKQELQYWINEFLPPTQTLDVFLAKNGRMQSIQHPFVGNSRIQIYLSK